MTGERPRRVFASRAAGLAASERRLGFHEWSAGRHSLLMQCAAALGLGTVMPLAFAPLHLLPALFIGVGGLFLLLMRTRSVQGAFCLGWLIGLGSFAVGLSCITEAFSVDAESFGGLAWPALGALAGGLAHRGAFLLAFLASLGLVLVPGVPPDLQMLIAGLLSMPALHALARHHAVVGQRIWTWPGAYGAGEAAHACRRWSSLG